MRTIFIVIAVILVIIGLMAFVKTFGNANSGNISFIYDFSVTFFRFLNIEESNMVVYGVISIIGAGLCIWYANTK